MAIDIAAGSTRFEMGRVVERTFKVIADNALIFVPLATLLSLPAFLYDQFRVIAGLAGYHITTASGFGALGAIYIRTAIAYAISIVFVNLLEAAITQGSIISLNGGKATFGECITVAISNLAPLIAIALIATIAVLLGFVLLVVPGIILMLMLCVATQVRVAEHKGIMDSLSRSAELTKGYKGQIFGLFVIYFIASFVIELIIRPLTGLALISHAGETTTVLYVVVAAVVQIALGLLNTAGTTSLYYELRLVKEGVGPEQLAAVFA